MHTTIMIPTAVQSTIVITPDHYGSIAIFAVSACKSAIMVSVTDSDIDTLSECGDCNAQSHNRQNNKQAVAHWTFPSIQAVVKSRLTASILLTTEGSVREPADR